MDRFSKLYGNSAVKKSEQKLSMQLSKSIGLRAKNKMKHLIYLLVIPIKVYQLILSPLLGRSCRFQPSCSNYAIEAIQKHGMYGIWLTSKRLIKCNPWGGHGFDPVPQKKE